MKKNDLAEVKSMDVKALLARVSKLRSEIEEAMMDKQMSKLKDLKIISKKRKDVAQILTVVGQKNLMEEIEKATAVKSASESKEVVAK